MLGRGPPELFLEEIATRYRAIEGVEGLFLMGSSALSEMIWQDDRLQSDVEFGVVVKRLSPSLRTAVRALGREIESSWGYELEPALMTRTRLEHGAPKNLSFRCHFPNQLMFDIQKSARWLLTPDPPVGQPDWRAEELPAWEATRLILNRFGEWAGAMNDETGEDTRNRDKFLVALGDARLIAQGRYVPGYGARRALFTGLAGHSAKDQWILAAYDARISGTITDLDVPRTQVLAIGRALIAELIGQADGPPDLITWTLADRRRVPVRYQAPFALFDQLFDSVLTMAAARAHHSGRALFARALALNVPLFLLVYQRMTDLLSALATPETAEVALADIEKTHAIWTRFSK